MIITHMDTIIMDTAMVITTGRVRRDRFPGGGSP
jgi:hypothetical protein